MYKQDTINQFIELRAQQHSLRRISATLDVSINTLRKWDAEYEPRIGELQAVRLEALQEQYVATHEQKLSDLAGELKRIDEELNQRDLQDVSTEFLLYRKTCLQSRLEKTALPHPAPRRLPVPSAQEVIQK